MFSEKGLLQIGKLDRVFSDKGFFLKEDLVELFEEYPNILEKVENTKFNKIEIFNPGSDSIGFTLDEIQVEFFVETGEDEEGPWYEAHAEVLYFGGEE
ncbi:MAG: hypothetical protein ACRC0Y_04525 [Fusobacteriaceae bacterium]